MQTLHKSFTFPTQHPLPLRGTKYWSGHLVISIHRLTFLKRYQNNVENLPEYANEPSNIWVAGSTSEPHKSETAGNLARQQPRPLLVGNRARQGGRKKQKLCTIHI